ncbi:hypothetical protein HK44_016095 [Pseudomonas fluorescens HK44]|uniref:Uncharacterized protein n=1 Tax=Pseudomonas fluorescens HK44 TaxID=1042209 RepID=A0A010T142_PSEFL|nr:hypothetical protein HK44_016095 [Pseudomonas fluorescens HK44]
MKAIRVHEYGNPDVLRLEDLADPLAGEGEVLIDVEGAAVNPIDWKLLSGAMKAFIPLPLPYTPGTGDTGPAIDHRRLLANRYTRGASSRPSIPASCCVRR